MQKAGASAMRGGTAGAVAMGANVACLMVRVCVCVCVFGFGFLETCECHATMAFPTFRHS